MSRQRGKERMFKGLQRRFQNRFHNPPKVSDELKQKFKVRRLLKPPRAKAHHKIPKKFLRKQKK